MLHPLRARTAMVSMQALRLKWTSSPSQVSRGRQHQLEPSVGHFRGGFGAGLNGLIRSALVRLHRRVVGLHSRCFGLPCLFGRVGVWRCCEVMDQVVAGGGVEQVALPELGDGTRVQMPVQGRAVGRDVEPRVPPFAEDDRVVRQRKFVV
jgi:hypothetical protein